MGLEETYGVASFQMDTYKHCCKCGRVDLLTTIRRYGKEPRPCPCGGTLEFVEVVVPTEKEPTNAEKLGFPQVALGSWKPDYRLMDGEKEAIAAGMYE